MKTAIVTFVRAYNYGATLQCYALNHTMKELGYDVEVLDYNPEYFEDQYNLSSFNCKSLPRRPSRMWLVYIAVRLIMNRRTRGFKTFIKRYISLGSQQYKTIEELNQADLPYDIYVSGSDQVWSNQCVPFDPVYFLKFASAENKKKCSYAASFGFSKIPIELEDEYRERLTDWNAYSVREKSGVEILKNLIGIEVTQCCDPTLLLTRTDWDKIRQKNVIRKPYILIYRVNGDKALLEYAKRLSKKKGLPVISLSSTMRYDKVIGFEERTYRIHHLGYAAPDEWLGLFAEADYILTDSFHGTVFSIINHKKFAVQLETTWSRNNRAKELLEYLQIGDREFSNNLDNIDGEVNWIEVDSRMQILRESSIDYLQKIKHI